MDSVAALKQYFGFERFRSPQDAVVDAILQKQDAMVVMPTGGGKSLCYQLPALMMPGVAVVISPLIALMKDQVDALRARNVAVGLINSSQSYAEQRAQIQQLEAGAFKLVYIAPERFRSAAFVNALAECSISFVAVDEAHCLSQWGHDFRPDYLKIGQSLARLGHPQVAAFTATATPDVRADILQHLQLREPAVFVSGFERKNLAFRIRHVNGEADKYNRLHALVNEHHTGIIYCATRKKVNAVSQSLHNDKIAHVIYHGGMDDGQREQAQNAFMSGQVSIAVATNAFGMGIDRADIRFVAHFEMPGSVEAFYQEAGRAGRDGLPAVCEMLFSFADKRVQEFFIEGANPSLGTLNAVYAKLRRLANEQQEVILSIDDLIQSLDEKINPMAVSTAIGILARNGLIERFDVPGQRIRGTRILQPDLLPRDLPLDGQALSVKRERDELKLKAVIDFAYSNRCRQQWILDYFGETGQDDCGRCDHCAAMESVDVRAGSEAEVLVVRKALSGVARMSNRLGNGQWQPRFGKRKVIQCLLGSKAEGIVQAGLDQLSTHGILRAQGKDYLNDLFKELELRGLLETTEGEYPMIGLTAKGVRVMMNKETPRLEWPSSGKQSTVKGGKTTSTTSSMPKQPQVLEGDYDLVLYEKLKKKRSQLAAVRGGVPPYVIFSNSVLHGLATVKPTTIEEGRQIPGIGEVKARKFLPTFLKIVQAHVMSEV